MLSKAIPNSFHKQPKPFKDSLLAKVLGTSAFIAVGVFIFSICYYTLILEPSPQTELFDCRGGSCVDVYFKMSGCRWPDVYDGTLSLTQPSYSHGDAKYASAGETGITSWPKLGTGRRRALYIRNGNSNNNADPADSDASGASTSKCESKDGATYFIIAGQNNGAANALENILVRIEHSKLDVFSVLNLSWTSATLAWTLSMTGLSLLLSCLGERYLNPTAKSPSVMEDQLNPTAKSPGVMEDQLTELEIDQLTEMEITE